MRRLDGHRSGPVLFKNLYLTCHRVYLIVDKAMLDDKLTFTALDKPFTNNESSFDRRDLSARELLSAQQTLWSDSYEPSDKSSGEDGRRKRPKIALCFALALVFVRFSMIHQIIAYHLNIDLYLLYVVGIPVFIGILTTGGLKQTFRYRPAVYWTAFS